MEDRVERSSLEKGFSIAISSVARGGRWSVRVLFVPHHARHTRQLIHVPFLTRQLLKPHPTKRGISVVDRTGPTTINNTLRWNFSDASRIFLPQPKKAPPIRSQE